jgi:hypothetical protein
MSGGVDCSGSTRILRIIMPPDWDAAPLTFQTSVDGVVYNNLHLAAPIGDFTTYPATIPVVTPGAAVTMPPNTGYGISWLRFRSGTFTAQTKQSADRTFSVVLEMPDAATGGGGAGTVGPTGAVGPAGAAGPQGPAGPAGAAGPMGPTGMSGAIGTQGATGATGASGSVGPQGAQGTLGPQGIAGPTGPAGVVGPTGTFNLKGVTDGSDAAPGTIGEVISGSNFAGVGLTTNVAMNVTTITLTPGDWTVGGVVIFTPVSTGPNSVIAALSQTAATLPSDNDVATGKGIMQQIWASSMPSGKTQTTPTSLIRVSTSTSKSVYLVALATFGGGTVTVTGYISARRVR